MRDDTGQNSGLIARIEALEIGEDRQALPASNGSVKLEGLEVTKAHQQQRLIQRAGERMNQAFIILARRLYEFDQARHWQPLGFETFDAWAAESGFCPVGVETARQAKRMYEVLVVGYGIPVKDLIGVGIGKMQIVMSGVREDLAELAALKRKIDRDPVLVSRLENQQSYEALSSLAVERARGLIADAQINSKSQLRAIISERRGVKTLASAFVGAEFFTFEQRSVLGLSDLKRGDRVHILIRSGLE